MPSRFLRQSVRALWIAPVVAILLPSRVSSAQAATLTVPISDTGKPISPDLFGIFFEDLNYAADGGLYGELIQNRSFEYQPTEQPTWNSFSYWELVKRGEGTGSWAVEGVRPVHPNNPHYMTLEVGQPGDGVGLMNTGYDGIPLKAGETYNVSFFSRQLFMNAPWGEDNSIAGKPMPVAVRLESKDGEVLAEATLRVTGRDWTRYTASLTPSRTDENARFVLLGQTQGGIALDELSLFPQNTFHQRTNGLRADLAQVIADLHPKFIRFPGGCLAHGDGVDNFYRWKDTIGPIERRKGQKNLWRYHQSVGLGYYEYFQFCEDIGAKPLPVLAAGVSCQNSDHSPGQGQQCLPIEDMRAYSQDILDLIEWANGSADSTWGAKRAAAGHPAPFGLQYLGIGNEDKITPGFKERFQMIYDTVKSKHPEIMVVGTAGPFPKGEDYEKGWKVAEELHVPLIDEHYYEPPQWFWDNQARYENYDRAKSKVYVGEYAAHDTKRRNTLRSALAEAAHLTSLERNGDVVSLSSYAPLLSRKNHTQWVPDLIYFTGTEIVPSLNYYVQQLFSVNSGDSYLPLKLDGAADIKTFAYSAVRDSKTGDVIIKLVNGSEHAELLKIDFAGSNKLAAEATETLLTSMNPDIVNDYDTPHALLPQTSTVAIRSGMSYEAPAYSITVFRLKNG